MIGRAIRFLQMRRAVPADFEQPVGELGSMFVPDVYKRQFLGLAWLGPALSNRWECAVMPSVLGQEGNRAGHESDRDVAPTTDGAGWGARPSRKWCPASFGQG